MGAIEVMKGIYNLGDSNTHNGLDCNPYLLVDGKEAVLFDPGANQDFELVYNNIKELIDPKIIKYVVLHHQDPDMCQSVPKYEELGLDFKIVTTWRAMTLIQYYGLKSEYYLLVENDFRITLDSGRVLELIPTPYLHFPGAFVTYDSKSKSLFSSDIFGAFSYNRTPFADENYMDKMLTFHEHYMPSNSVLRPVMDKLLTYDIDRILPQHGSMIMSDPKKYILALRTLECGSMLAPIKKDLIESGGFISVFNDIFRRLVSLFDFDEVKDIFIEKLGFDIDQDGHLENYYGDPSAVWNDIFFEINMEKGVLWLSIIDPYVRRICSIYDIDVPDIFNNVIQKVSDENIKLQEINESLEQSIKSVNERLTKCPITGLYNENFFKSLIIDELEKEDWRSIGAVALLSIDNHSKYILEYGNNQESPLLNNLAYLLKDKFGESSVYKMDSSDFAVYIKGPDKDYVINQLESLRSEISKSDLFLEKVTVSIGVVFNSDIELDKPTLESTMDSFIDVGLTRLRKAKMKGKNLVIFGGKLDFERKEEGQVLIIDSDRTNLQILSAFMKNQNISILIAEDGYTGYELAETHLPDLIISETSLPKLDGFLLREKLLENSFTKNIEMVFLSYKKDESSVKRALELGIFHFIKKPYLVSEVIGIIKRSING